MCIEILNSGLLTTIQDLGRYGFRKYGVIVSGSMDAFSHRISNLLVGNDEGEATLEVTLMGPKISIKKDTLISICGGNLSPKIDNLEALMWRPIYVKAGSILSFGEFILGTRCYIAFSGSFNINTTMDSKSTYLRAEIGGFHGRALKKGDIIPLNEPTFKGIKIISKINKAIGSENFLSAKWFVGDDFHPEYSSNPEIRVTKGGQFKYFKEESKVKFFNSKFEISNSSDRMGYRLNGHNLSLQNPLEMISEAVALGSIQVPPDGNPILLLADRQTTGGYPKIAEAITVDIPLLAQLKPGDTISFREVALEEAQRLYIVREKNIAYLKKAIKIQIE